MSDQVLNNIINGVAAVIVAAITTLGVMFARMPAKKQSESAGPIASPDGMERPEITEIAARQIEAQFARYEARLAVLERRDEEREAKLQEVEQDRERLASENQTLKNRVRELETRVQELEMKLQRTSDAHTRATDWGGE